MIRLAADFVCSPAEHQVIRSAENKVASVHILLTVWAVCHLWLDDAPVCPAAPLFSCFPSSPPPPSTPTHPLSPSFPLYLFLPLPLSSFPHPLSFLLLFAMLAFTAALSALVATSFVSAEATELQLQVEQVSPD